MSGHRTGLRSATVALLATLVMAPLSQAQAAPTPKAIKAELDKLAAGVSVFSSALPESQNPLKDPNAPLAGAVVRASVRFVEPNTRRTEPLPSSLTIAVPDGPDGATTTLPVSARVAWSAQNILPDGRVELFTNSTGSTGRGGFGPPVEETILIAPQLVAVGALDAPHAARVAAKVLLTVGEGQGAVFVTRTLEGASVPLPSIGLPRLLLLYAGSQLGPPALAVVEPGDQPGTAAGQAALLDRIALQAERLRQSGLSSVFGELADGARLAASTLRGLPALAGGGIPFTVRSEIGNLNEFTIASGLQAEGNIASILLIAPKGRGVAFFGRRQLRSGLGDFSASARFGGVARVLDVLTWGLNGNAEIEVLGLPFPQIPVVPGLPTPPDLLFRLSSLRFLPPVGTPALAPARARVRAGQTLRYRLTWTHPRNWNELDRVELRLLDGRREVGRVRFEEERERLALVGRSGAARGPTGRPGSSGVLRRGALSLLLARSEIRGSGPAGRKVTLRLALRLGTRLTGRTLHVELAARDDDGSRQDFEPAGTLRVAGAGSERP